MYKQTNKKITQAHDEQQRLPWTNILYYYKLWTPENPSASLNLSFENENKRIYPAVPDKS